jgi:hypothetical protein
MEVMRVGPCDGPGVLKKKRKRDQSQKAAIYKTGRVPSGTEPACIFTFDFSASRAGKNKCLFFRSKYQSMVLCFGSP